MPEVALDADLAAHQLDQFAADRQPQARPAVAARGGAVEAREALEELVDLRRCDAGTAVGDLEEQVIPTARRRRALLGDRDADAAAVRELDGIVRKVDQDLPDPADVAPQLRRDLRRDESGEVEGLREGLLAEQLGDAVDGRCQVEARDLQLDPAGFDL